MLSPSLAALAALHRVETEHTDGFGHRQHASPERLAAVLAALGVPLSSPDEHAAAEALAFERERRREALVEPCIPWFGGEPAAIPLRLPPGRHRYRIALAPEEGEVRELEGELDAESAVSVPGALPPGYYRVEVEAAGKVGRALGISAPARAFGAPGSQPPRWGAFAPIYALRSARNAGTGDLGDLLALCRWIRERGGDLVGTLPLLGGYLDEPFEPSPYSPATRLFWNELYVSFATLAAELPCPEGAALLASSAVEREIEALQRSPEVDYRRQMALTRRLLGAYSEWAWSREPLRARLEEAAPRGSRLDDYARFRAEVEARRTSWPEWPEPLRAGDLAGGIGTEAARRYHVFAQWVLEQQLSAFDDDGAAGLYLDLPVGVNSVSYDTWRERSAFAFGAEVGAPPDALFAGGQNWALPPLHPEEQRRTGYRYFIESIRTHMRHASLLRVDHVMGLHRLYWIPRGAGPCEGLYVRYPAEELYAILALESERNRCAVAGEDLGTVPGEVRPAMERRGIHRLFVAQFDPCGAPPPDAVASLGTHDTRTFARFAADELAGEAEELVWAWTEELAASRAAIVLVTLEDLWFEREPQNVPGSPSSQNWRRKMRLSLAELMEDPRIAGLLRVVAERRKKAAILAEKRHG